MNIILSMRRRNALRDSCSRWGAEVKKSGVLLIVGVLFSSLALSCVCAAADGPEFDLPGPRIEVNVTRAGKTLPVSEVPNLQAGDRLWLHPEIPASQTVHYLLIAVF